jgi:neutral amino acid transport system permease protein
MDFGQVLSDGLRAAIGIPAVAYALAAIGLNIHFGYTGLLNFGHVAFMLVGAYGTAIGATELGLPLPLAVLIGVAGAVLLALLLGLPTLRLRAEYLAIVTISVAEILRIAVRSQSFEEVTGGPSGIGEWAGAFYDINPIPAGRYGIGSIAFNESELWVLAFGWTLIVLEILLVRLLVRSPWGRLLRAVRDDEEVARSLGKNVFRIKLQSLVLGGVLAAFGGMVLAFDANFADPDLYKSILTFFIYTALILGGPATVLGPLAGAMIFWFILQSLDTLLRQSVSPDSWASAFIDQSDLGAIRFAIVGLALMVLLVYRPQGLFGDREEVTIDDR